MLKIICFLVMFVSTGPLLAEGLTDLEAFRKIEEYRRQLHRWDRMVRGFRREHSMSMTTGLAHGVWQLGEVNQPKRKITTRGYYSEFQYTFHLPIDRGFGYLLGSSFGSSYREKSEQTPFEPFRAIAYPGLLAGLVLNATPALRTSLSFDGHLERMERIPVSDSIGNTGRISINTRVLAFQAGVEVFFRLHWALRFEAAQRYLYYSQPNHLAEDSILATDLHKNETRYGVGFVYHLI